METPSLHVVIGAVMIEMGSSFFAKNVSRQAPKTKAFPRLPGRSTMQWWRRRSFKMELCMCSGRCDGSGLYPVVSKNMCYSEQRCNMEKPKTEFDPSFQLSSGRT